ncbi:hypothetical protein HMPREF1986_02529 [Oribacterium sp. oral taxon 078 str. F0263]|nr:hypothetical protein GCWU000341_01288 [Oribacterium sp. oral taxon 078 str. F0262]ERL05250.1 hypothetical protein HMPREF1986_02529 [Oribacterium sp. oral taxon 078 str. F0263]
MGELPLSFLLSAGRQKRRRVYFRQRKRKGSLGPGRCSAVLD